MTAPVPDGKAPMESTSHALTLLAVLPGEAWLTLDDVQAAAVANFVPVGSDEHAEYLLRNLKRRGFVRCRPTDDDAREWQVTPSGTQAATPL